MPPFLKGPLGGNNTAGPSPISPIAEMDSAVDARKIFIRTSKQSRQELIELAINGSNILSDY